MTFQTHQGKIYNNRNEKAKYIAFRYKDFLKEKILDVGCGDGYLKKYLDKNTKYTGIDIVGNPDIFVNLEKEKIPYPDNFFDCVVCADVLEHLDNIHQVFDELIRVSKKYVIVSLPNCYPKPFKKIMTGKGELKFYGLPIEKPADRHKWFFSYKDAEKFILGRAKRNHIDNVEISPVFRKRFFRNIVLKILLGKKYENIVYLYLWALIKKHGK